MDSVPYVMVILLSDASEMVGGDLLVARLGDPRKALEMIRTETIDPKLIDTVNYPGPGYAIFMQGAKIAHAVTPVVRAQEKRLTCINSCEFGGIRTHTPALGPRPSNLGCRTRL